MKFNDHRNFKTFIVTTPIIGLCDIIDTGKSICPTLMVLILYAVMFRLTSMRRKSLKKIHVIFLIVAGFHPSFAVAADLPAATSATPQQELPRWTGFYLGYNRGFGGGTINNGVIAYPLGSSAGVVGQSGNRSSGFIAGGQIGYNYQFANNFILGVESDLQWSDIKSSQ